jgi:hypothetical protein
MRLRLGLLGSFAVLAVAAPAASAADSWTEQSFDFGNQNVGSTSDPHLFGLTAFCSAHAGPVGGFVCTSPPSGVHNYGDITATGPGFAIVPGDTDVCNARAGLLVTPLANGADNCTLEVTFKPTSGGVVNGTLTTETSPSGSPLKVALKGTGILTGQPGAKKCKKKKKKKSAAAAKKCKKKKK